MYCCLVVGTDTKFFHYVQTSSGKVEFHPNGSLVIKKVEQADEGHYRYYITMHFIIAHMQHENMLLLGIFSLVSTYQRTNMYTPISSIFSVRDEPWL